MTESIQHKLDRVRPPRVQITYDVEIGNAIEKKELPFVLGILADLSGHNTDKKTLKQRKFVEIDPDNFNDILKAICPMMQIRVADKISGKKEGLAVSLSFEHIDHFGPNEIIKQVPTLNAVYEKRTQLRDLITKLDGNEELDVILQECLQDKDKFKKLKAEVDEYFKNKTTPTTAKKPEKAKEE